MHPDDAISYTARAPHSYTAGSLDGLERLIAESVLLRYSQDDQQKRQLHTTVSAPVSPQYGRARSPSSTSPAGGASPVEGGRAVVRSESHSLLSRYQDNRSTAPLAQLRVPKKKKAKDDVGQLRLSRFADYLDKGKAPASLTRASSFCRGNSIDAHPAQLLPAEGKAVHPHLETRLPDTAKYAGNGVPRQSLPSAGPASASSCSSSRPLRATPGIAGSQHTTGPVRHSDAAQATGTTHVRHADAKWSAAPASSRTGVVSRPQRSSADDAHAAKRLRFTIVELLRPILNPLYASGLLSRDQFKSTLKAVCACILCFGRIVFIIARLIL